MRVLFVALSLPYPPVTGHRLRTWAILRALAADGHEVSLVSFVDPGEQVDQDSPLQTLCRRLDLLPTPNGNGRGGKAYVGRMSALLEGLPYGAWRFHSKALRRRLEEATADGRYDLILCDGVYNMVNIPESPNVPVVLNKDDVAHVILRRYIECERNLPKRLYGLIEAGLVKQWERRACERASCTLACSEVDRSILQALSPQANIAMVPNVVDTDHYSPDLPGSQEEPWTVLFQGGMDWYPNQDAAEFFVAHILPHLRQMVPRITFRVAGRSPKESFLRRFRDVPGVEFTGTVPDMRDEIAKAAVCVVPLRIGSGTRLKILEAAAMGKPIVSTGVGAEGLDFLDRKEILLADEPEAFGRTVVGLLGDPGRRRTIGQRARRKVESRYSLAVLQAAVRQVLSGVGT